MLSRLIAWDQRPDGREAPGSGRRASSSPEHDRTFRAAGPYTSRDPLAGARPRRGPRCQPRRLWRPGADGHRAAHDRAGPDRDGRVLAEPGADRVAGWTADLEAIVPGLERHHPDPYHSVSKADLVEAIADLEASIPTATDDELMAGVLRVVAMVSSAGRDAHTGAYVWGSGTYPTHTLPLRLWVFPEGVAVVDALPPYEALVGRVIASLDGHPIADVLEGLEPLMPRDNPATVTLLAPRFLLTTEILHGAGLIDDPAAVELAFDDDPATGVDVAAIPTADYNDWATPYGLHLPTRPDVPWLARSEEPVWTRLDPDGTLFIQYNRVTRLASGDLDALRGRDGRPGGPPGRSSTSATTSAARRSATRPSPTRSWKGRPTGPAGCT